jgi:hypothetical protein
MRTALITGAIDAAVVDDLRPDLDQLFLQARQRQSLIGSGVKRSN